MLWWSGACALHGLAMSFGFLLGARCLLGMGEGGAFPAATRVVAEWIPVASAIDGDGNHQCRYGSRIGAGTAADRDNSADSRMENGVFRSRSSGVCMGGLVVRSLIEATARLRSPR